MATQCPKCHQTVESDYVCCADLTFTWKCDGCGKVSEGFSLPFGKCHLCGGGLAVISRPEGVDLARLEPVRKSLELESNAYHFYRLAAERIADADSREVFQEFSEKEIEHFRTIAARYHVHEDLDPDRRFDQSVIDWLMGDIDFSDTGGSLRVLYDKAIRMENRTREFYTECAEASASDVEREIYRELAAEEEEHAAILEAERDAFFGRTE